MADDIASLIVRVDSKGIKQTDKELKKLGKSADVAEKSSDSLGKSFAKTAAKVGALLVAVRGLGALFVSAIRKHKEFTKAVSELSAITGATGKDLKFYAEQAKEIGKTTTLSASQAVTAFKLIASAKPDLLENKEALAAVTKQAVLLAEATGEDLTTAANTVGSALNQFGAGAEEASRFVNVLAAGSKYGASEVNQMAEALKMSGVVASNAGLSFEETNAALQTLAAGAIKGTMAGTALRGVLLKLTTQANDNFNPAVVGMEKAFVNLKEANLSATEQTKLFGQEGITAAQILIKQSDTLDTLTGKLTGTQTALEQASVATDNLAGDADRLASAWEGLLLSFSQSKNKYIRNTTQALIALLNAVTDLNTEQTEEQKNHEKLTQSAAKLKVIYKQLDDIEKGRMKGSKMELKLMKEQLTLAAKYELERAVKIASIGSGKGSKKLKDLGGTDGEVEQEFVATQRSGFADRSRDEGTKERLKSIYETRQAIFETELAAQNSRDATTINYLENVRLEEEADTKKFTERFTALENSLLSEKQLLIQGYEEKQLLLEEANARGIDTQEAERQLAEEHQRALTEITKKGLTARQSFERMTTKEQTQFVLGELTTLTSGIADSSKEAFLVQKHAATATAIINTHAGVTKSLEAYPMPLAGIMAAMHLAAGMAQVQKIQSTSFGSSGGGGGSVGGASASSSGGGSQKYIPASDTMYNRQQQQGTDVDSGTINFNINAVDAKGIDQLIGERQQQIVGMISGAYAERGKRMF